MVFISFSKLTNNESRTPALFMVNEACKLGKKTWLIIDQDKNNIGGDFRTVVKSHLESILPDIDLVFAINTDREYSRLLDEILNGCTNNVKQHHMVFMFEYMTG